MAVPIDLSGKKIAVVTVTKDNESRKQICDKLHEWRASLTAFTTDGQESKGWDTGKSVPIDKADGSMYDALLIITDKTGNELLMDTHNVDRFIGSFFRDKKPVSAYGDGTVLLGQLGLLSGRNVSSDEASKARILGLGAHVTAEQMTTDSGLTTAVSSVPSADFASKVAEEVKEGRHAGQHA